MYNAVRFHLVGMTPLVMHNIRLADALHPITRALSAATKKRNKTEDDIERIAAIEWEGGLYVDEDDRPVIPGLNIQALLVESGKRKKLGKVVKAGALSDGNWPVRTSRGLPGKVEALRADPRFRLRTAMNVKGSRVMRSFPIFRDWSAAVDVSYHPELLDRDTLVELMESAGEFVGLMDLRPRYGRFMIEKVEDVKSK